MASPEQERAAALRGMAASLLRMADELDAAGSIEQTHATIGRAARPTANIWIDLQAELILQKATELYRLRMKREKYLPGELFGEPGWDLLLDLFIARLHRRNVSISSACLGANTPPTTALRWISLFVERGYVQRTDCVHDRRMSWLKLSDELTTAMINLLGSELGVSQRNDSTIGDYVLARDGT
jgi:hypothetical protein